MLDVQKLIGGAVEHVEDATAFHLPSHTTIEIPLITKYMLIELVAVIIICAIFIPLARKIRTGAAPKGRFWNFFEVMLLFIRNDIARPAIGKHADRYLPLLWTMFFFILMCNLLGLVPWLGSPTAALSVTAVLALYSFAAVLYTGIRQFGVAGFLKNLVPHMDLPGPLGYILRPMIFVIELLSLLIKHGILAIRLLANMFAGHLVLAVILGFIAATANTWLWYVVTPSSVLGCLALNMLELFVAFLQTYVFVFLTALFIGQVSHAH